MSYDQEKEINRLREENRRLYEQIIRLQKGATDTSHLDFARLREQMFYGTDEESEAAFLQLISSAGEYGYIKAKAELAGKLKSKENRAAKKGLILAVIPIALLVVALMAVCCESISPNTSSFPQGRQTIVYYGETGTKFHKKSCPSLGNSKHSTTLEKAMDKGREPCKICFGDIAE